MNGLLIGFIGVPPPEAEIIVTLAIGPVTGVNPVTSDERAGRVSFLVLDPGLRRGTAAKLALVAHTQGGDEGFLGN
jgi:hypothetical protein